MTGARHGMTGEGRGHGMLCVNRPLLSPVLAELEMELRECSFYFYQTTPDVRVKVRSVSMASLWLFILYHKIYLARTASVYIFFNISKRKSSSHHFPREHCFWQVLPFAPLVRATCNQAEHRTLVEWK